MKLTYIMDPHCGWCYGNSDNITAIYEQFNDEFDFELVLGGMLLGNNAPYGGEHFIQFLQNHTPRMVQMTGANVGESYYDRARDTSYQFSSLEPSAAIQLVKEKYPEKTFAFAKEVQKALFVEGKRFDQVETYLPILEKLSLDFPDFKERWMGQENLENTKAEFTKGQRLANGYPTLVITIDGKTERLAAGYFDREKMVKTLKDMVD